MAPRPEVVARTYAIMDRQITHLTRLVDDLLDVSRITRRKITLTKRPLDLRESLRQAAEAMQSTAREKGVRLDLDAAGEPLVVNADAVRIEQMIGNILGNAIKFTPGGGAIFATARASGGMAVVSIADTGVGIAPDQVDKVFELFAQGPRPLDRGEGGLGVGLTVVKLVAELHDGSAEIVSGAGRGTEVIVRLPLSTAGSVAVATPAGPRSATACRRVLVIEDNEDAAEALAVYLTHVGHEVVVAHDGHAGLEAALRHRPHVLLCDIGLPGLDGYEIARRLRADDRLADCVMVAITGYGDAADRERSSRAGFVHHITKPVDPEHLTVLIGELHAPAPDGV
jgi:CheY-like chemotaxis protein